jgi:hypothetical protein
MTDDGNDGIINQSINQSINRCAFVDSFYSMSVLMNEKKIQNTQNNDAFPRLHLRRHLP